MIGFWNWGVLLKLTLCRSILSKNCVRSLGVWTPELTLALLSQDTQYFCTHVKGIKSFLSYDNNFAADLACQKLLGKLTSSCQIILFFSDSVPYASLALWLSGSLSDSLSVSLALAHSASTALQHFIPHCGAQKVIQSKLKVVFLNQINSYTAAEWTRIWIDRKPPLPLYQRGTCVQCVTHCVCTRGN